ncbi:RNA polymerase sigma-70 factor [Chitinophaga barathri]|uniref:RNA polymerase sigma-70 factor n=1 Tax=Chitinophaga barathri TaxID=1647451 RepID=A0A3N4MUT5_9BACT|nr:RNA polymerase sigma-70 factor [Chitinophaga barathri]RPD39213.1 RNA polymerase sigma-70 factor [Chitinophaga barathri]
MSSRESEEILLVDALRENDVAAFDALYRLYFPSVYANILRLVREPSAAQDIVQEVFIRLWEKRHSLKAGTTAGNWLFVVSYNRSVNHLRATLRQRLHMEGFAEQADMSGAAEWDHTSLQLEVLEKAIDQLPPQRKKVFLLCKMEGKTYAEAASELQISHNTVKEHISKASRFIHDYIRLQPEWQALAIAAPLAVVYFS